MAKAISHIEKKSSDSFDKQNQALHDVLKAVTDSREALIVFLDILKEAHEAGLLEIIRGVLKAREDVGFLAFQQLNQPTMHHSIKNLMGLAGFLGKLEPDQLNRILKGVAHGIEKTISLTEEGKSLGIWEIAKNLRDPDVNSTMLTAVEFMKGMGEELRKDSPTSAH